MFRVGFIQCYFSFRGCSLSLIVFSLCHVTLSALSSLSFFFSTSPSLILLIALLSQVVKDGEKRERDRQTEGFVETAEGVLFSSFSGSGVVPC